MKKIMMIVCMMLVSAATFAEKGDKSWGLNFNYALDSDFNGWGLGGKARYELLDNLRGEGSFNYFFKHEGVSMWDLNVNLHYLISLDSEKANVYPLAGVTLLSANVGDGINYGGSHFGWNVGGGIEYAITESIIVNAELKWQIVEHWNHPVLSVGIAFPF